MNEKVESIQIPPQNEGGFVFKFADTFIVSILIAMLFIYVWLIPNPITGIDAGLKWLGAQQFANSSQLSLPEIQDLRFPPCPAPFLESIDGKMIPVFPPLPMAINGWIFRMSSDRFWWFLPLISSLILFYLIHKTIQANQKVLTSLMIVIFATPIAIYSTSFWEHVPALTFLTLGTFLLTRENLWKKHIGIFCIAFASLWRPEALLWGFGVLIFLRKNLRPNQFYPIIILFISSIFLFMYLHKLWIGTWLPLQILSNLQNSQSTISLLMQKKSPLTIWWSLFFGAGNLWIELICIVSMILFYVGYLKKNGLVYFIILIPIIFMITRILDSQPVYHMIKANGLIPTLPIVLFLPIFWKEIQSLRIWIIASITLIIGVMLMGETVQGVHWSARLLLPLAVPSSMGVIQFFQQKSEYRRLLQLLLIASILTTLYGMYWTLHVSKQQIKFIQSIPFTQEPIISSVPWIGGDLAPLQYSRQISFLYNRETAGHWLLEQKIQNNSSFLFISMENNPPIFYTEEMWHKLVTLKKVSKIPMPEEGYFYKMYHYQLTNDSVSFGQLAGEVGILKLARDKQEGLVYSQLALRWNPRDIRPAYGITAYGLENRNKKLVSIGLQWLPDSVQSPQLRSLMKKANDFLQEGN